MTNKDWLCWRKEPDRHLFIEITGEVAQNAKTRETKAESLLKT